MAYSNLICMGRKPQGQRINRALIPFVIAPSGAIARIKQYGKLAIALYVAQDLAIGIALGVAQFNGFLPSFPFFN